MTYTLDGHDLDGLEQPTYWWMENILWPEVYVVAGPPHNRVRSQVSLWNCRDRFGSSRPPTHAEWHEAVAEAIVNLRNHLHCPIPPIDRIAYDHEETPCEL